MTKHEAAIVSAYTGHFIGDFSELHQYIEKVMGRPVLTHQMANQVFIDELRKKTYADFSSISVE